MRAALGLPEGIAGIVMVIHTFGEYLDFHPHLHALVADGLFTRSGVFHVLPNVSLRPLEELFRARVIAFLAERGLLPPERARNATRAPPDRRFLPPSALWPRRNAGNNPGHFPGGFRYGFPLWFFFAFRAGFTNNGTCEYALHLVNGVTDGKPQKAISYQ